MRAVRLLPSSLDCVFLKKKLLFAVPNIGRAPSPLKHSAFGGQLTCGSYPFRWMDADSLGLRGLADPRPQFVSSGLGRLSRRLCLCQPVTQIRMHIKPYQSPLWPQGTNIRSQNSLRSFTFASLHFKRRWFSPKKSENVARAGSPILNII